MEKPSRSRTAAAAATLLAGAAVTAWLASTGRRKYSIAGKTVLITGGSRGLGLALAETFGRAGARLALTARDLNELERARVLLVERAAAPSPESITLLPCDITDASAVQEMVAQVTELHGRVDLLINNAGVIMVGPVENQPLAAFRKAMEVNYFGMVHATLAVLPQMLARSKRNREDTGTIVNIASIGGKVAVPHLLPYSASKFAVVGWSQGLHAELRSKGIRVVTVCPGLMRTGSPGKALFVGDQVKEYRWFHLGASVPGLACSAAHAARRILRGVETGEAELAITPQAAIASRLAQVSPALTVGICSLVNTLLLPEPVPDRLAEGRKDQSAEPLPGELFAQNALRPITIAGDHAAVRWNQ